MPDLFEKLFPVLGSAIEKVATGPEEGISQLELCFTHLATAKAVLETDPVASLQISYDAARKSIQSYLASNGLRVKSPPGNHWTFIQITRIIDFDQEIWFDLTWMKDRRNDAEYPAPDSRPVTLKDARESQNSATAMVKYIANLLSDAPSTT